MNLYQPVCFWDFGGADPLISRGVHAYELIPANALATVDAGCLTLAEGGYLFAKRSDVPALNINGPQASVTVMAWIRRRSKSYVQCEAIAGMWNETEKKRQYCLFIDLRIHQSANQVGGHISGLGGPTPGERWCMDASIGLTEVPNEEWCLAAFSYDGAEARSYLNGRFDQREGRNPYPYREGIFNGGIDGADFTVGAVHRLGEMGNNFVGDIAALWVFNQALPEEVIHQYYLSGKDSLTS
jgi:hypothetical protein